MGIEEKVRQSVQSVADKKLPGDREESLFESGLLDSFALPDLVSALEKEFGISIPDRDLNPRKFESVARIVEYVESRM